MKQRLQILTLLLFAFFLTANFTGKGLVSLARVKTDESGLKTPENKLPEIADLRHGQIGLGQRLTFGIEVIDEESDDIRIELIKKPGSAKFNQNTLTVDWTPTPADGKLGKFVVRVTESLHGKAGRPRTVEKEYLIEIVDKPVKLKELPPTSLEVNAFVSIIDEDRLKAAAKKWDIVSMFQRLGEIEAEKQISPQNGIKPSSGNQLFLDALKQLSELHRNPSLDPDSNSFDPVWKAENWKLIAVRPRINKKVFELRLVYFNTEAAEQAYLMPRMRIIRGDDATRPDELRQKNNLTFIRMFHEAFFDGQKMKDFVGNDKSKYSEALADFITKVLTYRDPDEPLMRANFAALPHNSRLGGGNAYDQNGNYLHGDGWLLGAMKVEPVQRDGKRVLAVTSPPMAGFVATIKPAGDGSGFKTYPAPATDPASEGHRRGWEKLYDESHGTVQVPQINPDGSVFASNIDTTIIGREYKSKEMVAETGLRDPRRRLFEEKGMTCIQCHVRNFDEGDYLQSVQKPGDGVSLVSNRPIPRVFFIITPTLHNGRNEYIHREEQEQVGNLQGAIRDYLGIKVDISSPLAMDWVHYTRKGRS